MNELSKKDNSLVTIAIPVFNGYKYLEKTIESIINQDYKKIEILISDNYSSDNTEKICRYYSKLDNRIKYIKQEKNIGAINNLNNLLICPNCHKENLKISNENILCDYCRETYPIIYGIPVLITKKRCQELKLDYY